MAGHTALIHEQCQTFLLLLVQGCFIAAQELVKIGIWRNQRGFIRFDRNGHVVKGYRIILTGKGLTKLLNIGWHAGQCLHNALWRAAHLSARLNRAFSLLREVRRAASPELGGVEDSIKDCRRVAWPFLPTVANRDRKVIVSTHTQVVAGIAADPMACGQTGLKKQHLTKLNFRFRQFVAIDNRWVLGYRRKHVPRTILQVGSHGCSCGKAKADSDSKLQCLPFHLSALSLTGFTVTKLAED